ncbi:MAG: LptF/LptG family permease [Armatimonadetes bacterium]|nr:LptF/LptG family permease [Armatimonadota bacterium]
MRIIDRYALKEMVVPTLAGMLVVVILMLGNSLYYLITDLVHLQARVVDVAQLLLLKVPSFAWMILPSGALFGCALAVTRLARDSELTMMRMAGVSVRRIFVPIFVVGITLSAAHYLVQEKVSPWAETRSKRVLNRIYRSPGAPPIRPNVFFNLDNYWFYVQRVEREGKNTVLRKVMVYELPVGEEFPSIYTAETAVQDGNVWVLKNGTVHKTGRDGFTDYEARFQEARLDLRRSIAGLWEGQKTTEEMTASELGSQIEAFGSTNREVSVDWRTNYHFKLSIPLSCFLIMLCVAPLCLRYGRTGGFMGVLIGILVLAAYWNIIVFGKLLGTTEILSPEVAGWSEVGIFAMAGILLMWKAE